MEDNKMEMMETEEVEVMDLVPSEADDTMEESGSGKVLGLVLAGLAGAATLGVVAYKKIKSKKGDKKPRKKKRLKWVEVDDEEEFEEDFEEDIIDGNYSEVEDESEEK